MAHSGKTMTFATNIVPQEGNTYNLGTDDLKWIIRGSLPLSDVTGADDLKAIEAISGTSGLLKKTAANTWALDTSNYVTSSGITSITIGATSPVQSSTSTAQTGSSASTTISLKDAYGDTKNPYGSKTKNYVLAAPSNANGAPSFRALVAADIPDLSGTYVKKVTSTDNAIVKFDGTGGQIQNSGVIINDNNHLIAPSIRIANTYYGISFDRTNGTPVETILHTGIKWVSSTHMPVIHITGYAYGLQSPVEFKIGFYIYGDKIGWSGATNMGSWEPDIYLFKDTRNGTNYVAVGLAGSCYFLQLSVDLQDEMGKFGNVVSTDWSWDFLTTTGTIPSVDDGTTCVRVSYKASIFGAKYANITTTSNAIAYYTNTTGTFGSKASANGALYATSANGALQWGILPIAQGGTGKTSASEAWTALGGGASGKHDDSYFAKASHNHAASDINSGTFDLARIPTITNAKLANSKVTIAGNDVSLGGNLTASTLTESLGLSKALRFIGVTTTDMTGGTTTNHSWTGTPAGISNYTPKQGDVVINSTKQDEWVCTSVSGTTYTWERLGSDTSYKIVQSPVTSATAETSTATTFVYSVTQDGNGVITVKTRPLPTYNNYSHPTGDGNLHVPATGTSNNGKVLKAGSTAGSISWGTLSASDVGAAPSSTVSCTTANVKSALGTGSDTTKFLNNKGEWAVPSYTTSLAWSAITSKPNLSTGNARIFYGTSNTAAGTAAKVVTCSIYDAYTAGDILVVKFDNANTAGSPTLNVNSKGAKNIRKIYNGAVNTLNANSEITGTCMFVYDGTQWLLTNTDYNNTYTIPTSFTITANATDGLWDLTGTNGTNAVTYALAPYSSKGTTATFYTAATNPTLTTRLNYDGYLYATKLYSGGTEVSVSGHTHSYLSSISWSGDTNLKLKQSVNGAAATDVLQFAAGSNITLTGASGKLTIAGTPDTKNTAGSTNSDSKLYLIGATSQAANPQTYSDAHVFETNGAFSAKTLGVNADTDNDKVTLQWNATDSSLDFVFA